jgi:hypothetical protein
LLCYDQNLTDIGPCNMRSTHHPLEVCKKKNVSTLYLGWGLGWVVIVVYSVVLPRLVVSRSIDFACHHQNSIDIGNIKPIHHPLEVYMKENISTL